MERLWLETGDDVTIDKWKIFGMLISNDLNIEELQKIPPEYITMVCVLHYLRRVRNVTQLQILLNIHYH